ncbi:MAG TPA: beta-galactosidase, partial [Verrucomicrobiae bacterium]|nr:beta-galactosidase [Verrucomicrobiae bacterium]
MRIASLFIMIAALACAKARAQSPIPHLDRQGAWTRLIVDGKPFIVIGGELHNSSASSLDYMEPIWPRLRRLNLNTVLATVSWELLEPQEGHYDFTLVDGLIEGARKNELKLVFLWFGSWKNGVSSYAPAWVKKDVNRFPRVQARDGSRVEILSPLSDENQKSDKRAFTALMQHIHKVDATKHTVIMMQIENEVGTLG